jgi:hypothetical protein
MWCWGENGEGKKWSEEVTNEEDIERIGQTRSLLNDILSRKSNSIGHNVRINCLVCDAIEGQMTEEKGV